MMVVKLDYSNTYTSQECQYLHFSAQSRNILKRLANIRHYLVVELILQKKKKVVVWKKSHFCVKSFILRVKRTLPCYKLYSGLHFETFVTKIDLQIENKFFILFTKFWSICTNFMAENDSFFGFFVYLWNVKFVFSTSLKWIKRDVLIRFNNIKLFGIFNSLLFLFPYWLFLTYTFFNYNYFSFPNFPFYIIFNLGVYYLVYSFI